VIAAFGEFLLLGEVQPARRNAIQKAIDTIQEQFLDLEQLKALDVMPVFRHTRVPAGIVFMISRRVSEFKAVYKGRQ
jgi:hypothetical protein